jgi:hypothetical protein
MRSHVFAASWFQNWFQILASRLARPLAQLAEQPTLIASVLGSRLSGYRSITCNSLSAMSSRRASLVYGRVTFGTDFSKGSSGALACEPNHDEASRGAESRAGNRVHVDPGFASLWLSKPNAVPGRRGQFRLRKQASCLRHGRRVTGSPHCAALRAELATGRAPTEASVFRCGPRYAPLGTMRRDRCEPRLLESSQHERFSMLPPHLSSRSWIAWMTASGWRMCIVTCPASTTCRAAACLRSPRLAAIRRCPGTRPL